MTQKLVLLFCILFVLCIPMTILAGGKTGQARDIKIGLVAKSQSNAVFLAAYAGARVAAKELGEKRGVKVVIDWRTPQDEDARKQAQFIEQLARDGAAGIAVACSDADILTSPINNAVDLGTPVICFDSDAPNSKRFAYYGTDDFEFARMAVKELAGAMNNKGVVAILGGNKNAPNLQRRVQGVISELKKFPSMKLLTDGVFYNAEIPKEAAEAVARAQKANPQIAGWVFAGGWPLFAKNGIGWKPGKVKIVACDALPAELEYIKSGHAQALIAQNCFMWGYKSVELLLDKILKNQTPAEQFNSAQLVLVTKANLEEWSLNWKKWLVKEAVYR
jgi:ribose transport system substrate-binding protein